MKKLIGVVVLALIAAPLVRPAAAQTVYGARGGLNIATIGGDADLDSRLGIYVGVFAGLGFGEFWSLQPELAFSQKGMKDFISRADPDNPGQGIVGDRTVTMNYLELQVPLVLTPKIDSEMFKFRLYGGATIAYMLSCSTKLEDPFLSNSFSCDENTDLIDPPGPAFTLISSFDYGVVLGAGLDIGSGPSVFSIDVRYDAGLADIHDVNQGAKLKNQVYQLLIGYAHRKMP
jgi:hypothetical protein